MFEITIALSLTAAAAAYAAIARADGDDRGGVEHLEASTPAGNPAALPRHLVSPAAVRQHKQR